jgi:methyl-accepting chemotaxis protein
MAEKEPNVAPIIRLPQLRATGRAQSRRVFEARRKPGGESAEKPPEEYEAEAEEDAEDEKAFNQPLKTQVSGDQARLGDTAAMRSGVSSLLRRALLNFAEQERQRATLITILLATQAAILLAILPGDLFGQFQLTGTLVVLGGLAVYGIVWLLNWTGRIGEASYLLVIGGGALVVLDLLLSAVHLLSLETLHISLLFVLVILAGGILFSPETALILSMIFALFTAVVLLVFHPSSALETVFMVQGRYLALVYLVTVQLGVGVVAWLFGRQMQENVHLITYVAGLQMSNQRLHKRLRETADKKRHLEAGIAIIQQTHARVAAGDYSARAHVEGDLLPLAVSLNLMLERVESFVHGEQKRERMETAVAGLAEMAGRVGQESLGQIPVPTGTALDGLSIAIKQMQANVNQRLARVQQSADALMATVGHCQDDLLPVAEALQEHLRSIDALVLAADNVLYSAQRQAEFATQAEGLLLSAAPVGVMLKAEDNATNRTMGTSALRLADEMERHAAVAAARVREMAPSAEIAAGLPELASSAESVIPPAPAQAPHEPEQTPGGELAAFSASLEAPPTIVPLEEPPAETTSDQPPAATGAAQEDGASAEQEAVEVGQGIIGSTVPVDDTQTAGEPAVPETLEDEATPTPASVPALDAPHKITLAEIDREVAEEEALREPEWHLGHLRELADVLGKMTGEATQQERNARTLTYKLRAMLQGMPTTRGVDVMAERLRSALEAIAQSANQVHQASKTLPASAFQASRRSSNEG